jgi:hypothetical protein
VKSYTYPRHIFLCLILLSISGCQEFPRDRTIPNRVHRTRRTRLYGGFRKWVSYNFVSDPGGYIRNIFIPPLIEKPDNHRCVYWVFSLYTRRIDNGDSNSHLNTESFIPEVVHQRNAYATFARFTISPHSVIREWLVTSTTQNG